MKKVLFLTLPMLLTACFSKYAPDYIIIDASQEDKPEWVENLKKYEKSKNANTEEYKYFVSNAESINKLLCEQSAIANTNRSISAEISNEIISTFTSNTEAEETNDLLITDSKKQELTSMVRNKLSGVELEESYWEKRKYSYELGADKEKLVYVCYQLAKVKKDRHDKIVNEMLNKQLLEIKK